MSRRRRIPAAPAKPPAKPKVKREPPKPKPKPVVEEVDPRLEQEYHVYNPMREDGTMPHMYDGDGFVEYLILNGMSVDIYWVNIAAGELQALDIEKNGMPIPTDKLTPDQKGWAKADHFEHFQKETARWRPVPGKDSKVKPWQAAPRLRDRLYNSECEHGSEAKLKLWGYRWDMRELHQCQLCGEVIAKAPFSNNGTINQEDNEHDEDRHDDVAAEPDHAT